MDIPLAQTLPGHVFLVPLTIEGQVWGCLGLRRIAKPWLEEEQSLACRLADELALTIHHASLHDRLQKELAERLSIEASLRRSEERLRLALDSGRLAFWDCDPDTGQMVWSDREMDLLGYTSHSVTPSFEAWLARVHPEDRPRIDAALAALSSGASTMEMEHRVIHPDGKVLWLRATVRIVTSEGGHKVRILGTNIDITADVLAREDLKRAKKAAEAATQAKSDFLAAMSHEIRTPMNAVLGMAELLRTTPLTPNQHHLLNTVLSSGDVLLTLVNSILDFSRVEAGQIDLTEAPVDLRRCVEEIVELLSLRAAEKSLTLKALVDVRVPTSLLTDATRVRQVLFNVVGNAVKFTERGNVTVTMCSKAVETGLHEVEIAVTDTGPGIAADALQGLFLPFHQVDRSLARRFGGAGLGLAISQRLCQLMGGGIQVTSQVGKGSTFRCTFRARSVPLSAPLPQLPPSIFDATFASRFPHRILVAEDDAISRDVVELMLEHLGYTADFATNGREALEALERESYDFVLMDVQMPELDGLDATRRLRQRNIKHLWIVGLSAHAFQSSRDEAMAAGMNDYLTKPVSVASLAEAFNRAPPRPA